MRSKNAQGNSHDIQESMLGIIERLATASNASVRKALAPIGRSCSLIELRSGERLVQTMDVETKEAFSAGASKISDHSKQFTGVISEFDMTNGSCRVQLESEDERVSARVIDPVYGEPNNPYVEADGSKGAAHVLGEVRD